MKLLCILERASRKSSMRSLVMGCKRSTHASFMHKFLFLVLGINYCVTYKAVNPFVMLLREYAKSFENTAISLP